jgi:hypothetical protein
MYTDAKNAASNRTKVARVRVGGSFSSKNEKDKRDMARFSSFPLKTILEN